MDVSPLDLCAVHKHVSICMYTLSTYMHKYWRLTEERNSEGKILMFDNESQGHDHRT